MAGRLRLVLAPILGLTALTVVLALGAWLLNRTQVLVAAAGSGLALALFAIASLYGQVRQRQSAQRSWGNVEARIGDIVEAAMDPIVTVDEQQMILVFNAAAEKVFAWPRAAMIGQPLGKLIPERFHERHQQHIAGFGSTGTTSRRMGGQAVLTALRANGEEFPIEASISQHSEDGHKRFTVILRDISERLRDEIRLAQSEARLRGVLDSAMDAIITIDERQHIVLFNAAAEAMFGCSQQDAVGAPLNWLIPERFRAGHGDHVRSFGETPTATRRMGEQRIVTGLRRNGEEFPIDASISQLSAGGAKFFTVILRDVTERVRTEQALRRSKEELRELGAAANEAREQEKSRISRELHDELGQTLTALQMDVAWFRQRAPQGEPTLTAKLDRMEALLHTTVAATRRIAGELRPLVLDDLGLLPAIEWLMDSFTQRTGVECEFKLSDIELNLSDAQASAVFRVIQESLNNVAKHAHASRVEICIDRHAAELKVSVRDDGVGFTPQDPRKRNSFGLLGLRERASMLGGQATVSSSPGKGTRVDVSFPSGEGARAS
jgi:PAS domain S-box-containing protein